MRLGINLLCVAGEIGEGHRPMLELARACGYDGVEVPVLAGDPDGYARVAGWLDDLGLARTCTAVIPEPDADPTSADPAVRARGRAHLGWIMDCAEALGAESVGGPFHAPIGHFTGAGPTAEEWERGAQAHRVMAERAARGGMILSLEPLNRFETHFLNTMEQARAYAALVDHPAFRLMPDTFHAHIEEKDTPAALEGLGGLIGVLHVSENDRGIPGTGQVDFPAIFAAAKRAGHEGWVVVEAFGSGLPELAAATRIWRPLFPDHETLFREAHDYVRQAWGAA